MIRAVRAKGWVSDGSSLNLLTFGVFTQGRTNESRTDSGSRVLHGYIARTERGLCPEPGPHNIREPVSNRNTQAPEDPGRARGR